MEAALAVRVMEGEGGLRLEKERESDGERWQYTDGDMEASRRMSMRRPYKVDTWRRFLDEPIWWATREELD